MKRRDDCLFVYGTLRRQADKLHPLMADQADYLDDGWLPGRLYEVDRYPAAVYDQRSSDKIHGELFRLQNPQAVLQRLDDYEECTPRFAKPWEYRRALLSVNRDQAEPVWAWVYVYNWPIDGLKSIASGDYAEFSSAR